jgi:hypothetical protein
MNVNLPRRQLTGTEPLKHVIDEYRHKAQTVTCACGWHGSTAAPVGERSAWDLHKAAARSATGGRS